MIRQAGYWPEFNQSSDFATDAVREGNGIRCRLCPYNGSNLSWNKRQVISRCSSLAERSLHCADDGYVRGRRYRTTDPKPTSMAEHGHESALDPNRQKRYHRSHEDQNPYLTWYTMLHCKQCFPGLRLRACPFCSPDLHFRNDRRSDIIWPGSTKLKVAW